MPINNWPDEKRKAYQREYYRKNREKALKYQRNYQKTHNKTSTTNGHGVRKAPKFVRPHKKDAFTASDIMALQDNSMVNTINNILADVYVYVPIR